MVGGIPNAVNLGVFALYRVVVAKLVFPLTEVRLLLSLYEGCVRRFWIIYFVRPSRVSCSTAVSIYERAYPFVGMPPGRPTLTPCLNRRTQHRQNDTWRWYLNFTTKGKPMSRAGKPQARFKQDTRNGDDASLSLS